LRLRFKNISTFQIIDSEKIKDFLLFCAGVDRKILEKAPTDVNKYVGIGATVLFTGILAFFSQVAMPFIPFLIMSLSPLFLD